MVFVVILVAVVSGVSICGFSGGVSGCGIGIGIGGIGGSVAGLGVVVGIGGGLSGIGAVLGGIGCGIHVLFSGGVAGEVVDDGGNHPDAAMAANHDYENVGAYLFSRLTLLEDRNNGKAVIAGEEDVQEGINGEAIIPGETNGEDANIDVSGGASHTK
ncbi:glycine-rich cell wall structural protein-like [Capsicum annuum]|uniref:glycine-rich cell wall structural protein-like n=1 Tax=Capsicum annuum TaxID=4072 RepID=UPI001FB138F8|nr:glycine-rich cell wall structural protein-like [Capsicum annuum]